MQIEAFTYFFYNAFSIFYLFPIFHQTSPNLLKIKPPEEDLSPSRKAAKPPQRRISHRGTEITEDTELIKNNVLCSLLFALYFLPLPCYNLPYEKDHCSLAICYGGDWRLWAIVFKFKNIRYLF